MSLPGADRLSPEAQKARLTRLIQSGRLIQLSAVAGGQVVHTGFGFGPEFWVLPEGASPDDFETDGVQVTRPAMARLICDGPQPLSDPDPLLERGATITMRLPQF